jgi:hypothetical protein
MDDVREKLYEHESKLTKVETILERVAMNQDKMADAVTQISSSIIKQELILEKLSSLETNSKGSFERIHSRIDALVIADGVHEEALTVLKGAATHTTSVAVEHEGKLNDLEIFRMMRKYPVATILVCLGFYSLTFEQTRNALSSILGMF